MKKILPVILGVGFLYRLLFLGKRQLWTDELTQALIVRLSSVREMLEGLRGGMAVPAPLDYFVQKAFVLVLGESNWTLRLHAVVFGTLSLWFFFRIARLLFGERVALYSTVLLTFYPLHYHYSQEGRPYALFVFLTLVSYDVLLRKITQRNGRFPDWILIVLVLVLTLYTSFLGVLVLISQWIAVLISAMWASKTSHTVRAIGDEQDSLPGARWSHLLIYSAAAAVACALYVPWVKFAWSKPVMAQASEIADPKLILRLIKELGDNSYPMAFLLLLGASTGVRALRCRGGRQQVLVWLLTWFAVSIPAVISLELWAGYFFAIRHILHTTPALVLLAGYGLSYVGERLTILDRLPYRFSSPAILYAALMIVISVWIAQSHWKREPVDWLGTARFLQENLRPGDVLAMPEVYMLLEYHAPVLGSFRVADLAPGPGSLRSSDIQRRFVACFNRMPRDPCASFRAAALKDPAWRRQEFRGFTIFIRQK